MDSGGKSDRILIGKITAASGVRGEVRVYSYAEKPDRFSKLKQVFVGGTPYELEHAGMRGGMVVLKLAGVDTRDMAERLRGRSVEMDASELEPLPENQYYIRDLIGLRAVDDETGVPLGTVADVLTDRPQDIYVVKRDDGRECLVPGVAAFVRNIDLEAGEIRIRVIEGLME